MNWFNNILCTCALSIGLCASAYAALPGTACRSAIPMGQNYSAQVQNGQTIWYSAWTFDLPLTVTFAPDNGANDPAPLVEMDFTCTPGYYRDTILCSLFCQTSGSSGISFKLPHSPSLSSKTLDDGTFVYYLSLGERYRDLLLKMGISYNVEVFVKVTYRSNGTISLSPDQFSNCMDGPKFMQIGDTVQVVARDKQRHVIVPYVQWQEDTIVYSWTGTQPCTFVVAKTCDFDPIDNEDGNIIEIEQIAAGGSAKASALEIYDWVHNPEYQSEAGMYFAKAYSNAPGTLKVSKAPQAQPEGNATLLRYDKIYPVPSTTQKLFAIPRSWNMDVKFSTPTDHLFSMEISASSKFPSSQDSTRIYTFDRAESGRWKGIPGTDLKALWNKVSSSKHYLYIRFTCSEATTILPERWYASDCYKNTVNSTVNPGDRKTVGKNSTQVYRFLYPDWVGGDMTIGFALNSNCEVYLADTCGMNTSVAAKDYWLKYKAVTKSSAPLVIPASEIASWAEKIDEEGFFYGIFRTSVNSTNRTLTFTTSAPAEKDPEYPHTTVDAACQEGTTNVYLVRVTEPQTLTLYDSADQPVQTWAAVAEQAQLVGPLASGTYHIVGASETIEIVVP